MESLKEECGVFGAYDFEGENVNLDLFYGLFALQHRGQEGAGFVLFDGEEFLHYRNTGLISQVFSTGNINQKRGFLGIAHTRYSTQGKSKRLENLQPIVVRHSNRVVALSHNGNLSNYTELRREIERSGGILVTDTDSEVFLHLYLKPCRRRFDSEEEEIVCRINSAARKIRGAYSIVMMDHNNLIGFRDPHGFRPLVLGRKGKRYFIASETSSFDALNAEFVREIEPGEIVIINPQYGVLSARVDLSYPKSQCVFELIYFSRQDSIIFGQSVYEFRKRSGEKLAEREREKIDVVVPVPDSGFPAALGYSQRSGKPLELGLIRSHYVGRSFIEPTQFDRVSAVRMKLLPVSRVLKGKSVALIDDSIVRGTTSRDIVKMLYDYGAREVHLRIASPPIISPCFFGVDTPTRGELVAASKSVDQIREFVGADSLMYLDVNDLYEILGEKAGDFCFSCFTGVYKRFTLPDREGLFETIK